MRPPSGTRGIATGRTSAIRIHRSSAHNGTGRRSRPNGPSWPGHAIAAGHQPHRFKFRSGRTGRPLRPVAPRPPRAVRNGRRGCRRDDPRCRSSWGRRPRSAPPATPTRRHASQTSASLWSGHPAMRLSMARLPDADPARTDQPSVRRSPSAGRDHLPTSVQSACGWHLTRPAGSPARPSA